MKLGWLVAVVVLATATGLYLSRKPWQVYREQQAKAEGIKADMSEAEKERVRLMEQKAALTSSIGREEAIRAKGWRKPNESPVDQP